MGFFDRLFGKKPPDDAVKRSVTHKADGSQVFTTEFKLEHPPRPVEDSVVTALDDALTKLGTGAQVMHAMDPSRLLSFEHGGPPVWSIGIVETPGYTLLVTYGFSHVLSPEPMREGIHHEYSFAVPKGTPTSPWADAFLRHQCRYVLMNGADIRVGDCVPFRGVPMTRIPFQPAHHAMMPDSSLVGMLCTSDPVLPQVQTPRGPIEVRRLVCIDARELDRVETWSAKGFLEELRAVDPLLISPLMRPCHLDNETFRATVERRFAAEGSDIDAAMFDLRVSSGDGLLHIELPTTPAGRERFANALLGRVGFGRRLVAFGAGAPPLEFSLREGPSRAAGRSIEITGDLKQGDAAEVMRALRASERIASLRLP